MEAVQRSREAAIASFALLSLSLFLRIFLSVSLCLSRLYIVVVIVVVAVTVRRLYFAVVASPVEL